MSQSQKRRRSMTPIISSRGRSSRVIQNPQAESKQFLKQPYFNIVQSLFTEEILKSKKNISINSKIMYFFGALFHGLRKGIVKPTFGDFMSHGNKIFNTAKISQIKQIIAEYQRVQPNRLRGHQEKKGIIESEEYKNPNTQLLSQKGKAQILSLIKQQNKKIQEPQPMGEIFATNNNKIQNSRKIQVFQNKQTLRKVGEIKNCDTNIISRVKQSNQAQTKNLYLSQKDILGNADVFGIGSQMGYSRGGKENGHQCTRVPGKLRGSVCKVEDDKLSELNNKLEYYIKLNKEHLMNSKNIRQSCS